MVACRLTVVVVLLCLIQRGARATDPPAARKEWNAAGLLPALSSSSPDALAGSLRGYLVRSLPNPLYEASPGWGNTRSVVTERKWAGKGLHVHPKVTHELKNHGTWRRVRLTAERLADTLVFDMRDFRPVEPGRTPFTVFVSFDVRVDYEKQNWDSGVRLYSGSTRATLRVKLTLNCEVTTRLEPNGTILPDAIFRLRVVRSDLQYDHFVVEHIAGLGGEMARLLGDAVKGGVRRFDPALERELLARANAAIEKAGDTKEVRLSLSKLIK
jgi:hypothetical protein